MTSVRIQLFIGRRQISGLPNESFHRIAYAPGELHVGQMKGMTMTRKCLLVSVLWLMVLNTIAVAADPYDYAARWRLWSVSAQEAYVEGLTDGVAEAYFVIMENIGQDMVLKKPEPPQVTKVRERLFVRDTGNHVREVISDLYKDPANAYISSLDMFFLARDKIEGKDITKATLDARKKAMETHRLNEQMKNK